MLDSFVIASIAIDSFVIASFVIESFATDILGIYNFGIDSFVIDSFVFTVHLCDWPHILFHKHISRKKGQPATRNSFTKISPLIPIYFRVIEGSRKEGQRKKGKKKGEQRGEEGGGNVSPPLPRFLICPPPPF